MLRVGATHMMRTLLRTLAAGLLLTLGYMTIVAPTAAADTYCNGILYNPLNGNPMESTCSSYSSDSYCSYYSNDYTGAVSLHYSDSTDCYYGDYGSDCSDTLNVLSHCDNWSYDGDCSYDSYSYDNLHYEDYTYCYSNGYGYYCYLGLVYYDPNIRVGLC